MRQYSNPYDRPAPAEYYASAWNRFLDSLSEVRNPLGLAVPAYYALGCGGIAAGSVTVLALGLWLSIPLAALAAVGVVALATFLGAGLVRKAFLGRDCHILLEDVLLVFATTSAAAWIAGQSVLRILDLVTLGSGVFLIFGRIGCSIAGCCHGKPTAVGIRYHTEAVAEALHGVRLFPLQLLESAWFAVLAFVTFMLVLAAAPGTAMWFWVLAYACTRFFLEFARGDIERRRLGPLTEAQWIAVALVAARVAYEPTSRAAIAVAAGAVLLVLTAYVSRRRWLTLPQRTIAIGSYAAWTRFLEQLESEAASNIGREIRRESPLAGVQIGLMIDRYSEGRQAHSYAIRGEADETQLGGMIAQRLPRHELLRASYCESGTFHLWAMIDPKGRPGSTSEDDPRLIALRAQAFAYEVESVPPLPQERPEPSPPQARPGNSVWYFQQPRGRE